MNFSKNKIKTLLKKKNKLQSRKRYKKKHKKDLKNKKNSFRRKKINIRKKSIKKYKSKRIAKKKRKAYIKQKGGSKKITWYDTRKKNIENIEEKIQENNGNGEETDFDAYCFDFFYQHVPRIASREDLIQEFKNITDGLPPGYSPGDETSTKHDDDDEKAENAEKAEKAERGESVEKNTGEHLASINDCTPETIIHVGDGTPGNRRSYLFQDAPKGCNPKDSIDALWKNLFDMGI